MDGGAEDVCVGDEDEQEGVRRRASLTLTSMDILAAPFVSQGGEGTSTGDRGDSVGSRRDSFLDNDQHG